MWYPALIGAAFFEQKRERKGGLIDIEFKPSDDLTFDLSGFYSKLDAANYNRNYLEWLTHFVEPAATGQGPDPGLRRHQRHPDQANFSPVAGDALRRLRPDLAPR